MEFGFSAAGRPLGFVFRHERDETGAGDMECTLSSPAGSAHQTSSMSMATVLSKGLEKRGCPTFPTPRHISSLSLVFLPSLSPV